MADYLEVVILGRVAPKKNNKRCIKRGNRIIVLPSAAFGSFQESALKQLLIHRKTKIDPPYEIHYEFFMKGKGATDGDNMECSINDILQKSGIIGDDKDILKWSGTKFLGCKEYQTVVVIKTIGSEDATRIAWDRERRKK